MPRKKFDAVGVGLHSMDQCSVVKEHPAFCARSAIPETARRGDEEAGAFSLGSLKTEGVNMEGRSHAGGAREPVRPRRRAPRRRPGGKRGRMILWRRGGSLAPGDVREDILRAGRSLRPGGHHVEAAIRAGLPRPGEVEAFLRGHSS